MHGEFLSPGLSAVTCTHYYFDVGYFSKANYCFQSWTKRVLPWDEFVPFYLLHNQPSKKAQKGWVWGSLVPLTRMGYSLYISHWTDVPCHMMHEVALGRNRQLTHPFELKKLHEQLLTQASDLPLAWRAQRKERENQWTQRPFQARHRLGIIWKPLERRLKHFLSWEGHLDGSYCGSLFQSWKSF